MNGGLSSRESPFNHWNRFPFRHAVGDRLQCWLSTPNIGESSDQWVKVRRPAVRRSAGGLITEHEADGVLAMKRRMPAMLLVSFVFKGSRIIDGMPLANDPPNGPEKLGRLPPLRAMIAETERCGHFH